MIVSFGDPLVFFKEPVSCSILVFALLFTILVMKMNKKMELDNPAPEGISE
jgi:TctA family transporter